MSGGARAALLAPGDPERLTGGNLYDRRIAAGLQQLGWRVELSWIPGRYPAAGAREHAALATALEAQPDGARVVIDGLLLGALPQAAALQRERLRLIALVHHPLAEETGLAPAVRRRLAASERQALAHARKVIVPSAFTARRVEVAYGVPASDIVVVEPGCDPAAPAAGSGDPLRQHWLCIAAVTPRKGHDVLLHALARIPATGWRCTCVGALHHDRVFAAQVLALHTRLDLADRVRFVGECAPQDLGPLWNEADTFVLASHYEGYGMVLTEAVARALPVVATAGGAAADTLPPGTALLARPGDPEGLAAHLRTLLLDAPARQELKRKALEARPLLADWGTASRRFAAAIEAVP